jgi:hypothetical protein
LEPSAPDEDVEVVELAVELDPLRFNTVQTFPLGVDEFYVGEVEGLEVIVVELFGKGVSAEKVQRFFLFEDGRTHGRLHQVGYQA